ERRAAFVSCPVSNLVLGGFRTLADITTPYGTLERNHRVRLVRDSATAIDPARREVRLAGGAALAYDRAILSPGVDLLWDELPALRDPAVRARMPAAWE